MSKIAVFATLRAQEGKGAELVKAMQPLVDAAAEEEGTELYITHVSDDEPDVLRVYELYADEAAMQAHMSSDAMKAAAGSFAGVLAGPPEMVFSKARSAKGVPLS